VPILNFHYTHDYSLLNRGGIQVPVELALNGRTVRFPAKVDTGADFCIFQREYAEQLGIDVESGHHTRVSTAISSFDVYGHELTMSCFEWQFDLTVYFPSIKIRRNVLGRAGWIQNFKLAIIAHDSLLHISHYDDL
jgi:hypothetical protein